MEGSSRYGKAMDHAFVRHAVHSRVTPGAVFFSFHKGVLTRFGDRKRGYNHSRNKVCHAVVEWLPPLFTEANFEVVDTVIFDQDERGCLLTWETEPGHH